MAAETRRSPASTNPVDVVVLDLAMPGMDGRQVLRALRQSDAAARVIVASGGEDAAWLDEVRAAGAALLLPKPDSAAAMSAALSAVLAAGHAERGADAGGG
jgi:DNA-binding NarL/FixJ family response regulator